MSNEHNSAGGERDNALPSVEQVARLDAFLDQLIADRQSAPHSLPPREIAGRMLAAQLRLACAGVEEPTPQFLSALERVIAHTLAQDQRQNDHPHVSRGRLLRTTVRAATAAGLVGAGVAADTVRRHLQPPMALVAEPGRWYDIAAADELASGHMKPFTAGGVLGYLVNVEGRLHAVSALCTHMGCRLKPEAGRLALRCLCHGAHFSTEGHVLAGPAPQPLPRIDVWVEGGRVYARGTAQDV